MAAVDLSELIPDLEVAMVAPGETTYSAVSDAEWLTRLRNAFWTAFNDGLLSNFRCSEDGIVTSADGSTFTRDLQQIVIFYCGVNALQNSLAQIKTSFRAKAGPVEYETQQSATVLKGLLDALLNQKALILDRLAAQEDIPVAYIDAVRMRDYSLRARYIDWNY